MLDFYRHAERNKENFLVVSNEKKDDVRAINSYARKRIQAGFTLAEVLIVIAIMAILAGFGFVAVSQYNKRLTLLEMDDTAKKIFLAAQNHLTVSDASGAWKQLVTEIDTEKTDIEESAAVSSKKSLGVDYSIDSKSYKVIYGGNDISGNKGADVSEALNLILPPNAVNLAGDGSYAIIYDKTTATIYGVYYSASSTFGNGQNAFDDVVEGDLESTDSETLRNSKEKRREQTPPIIGYYGNATSTPKTPGTKLKALEKLKIRFINDEKSLRLEITDPNKLSLDTMKIYVVGEESGADETFDYNSGSDIVNGTLKVDGSYLTKAWQANYVQVADNSNARVTTIIFDQIASDTETPENLQHGNLHFADLFPNFYPGENISATVSLSGDIGNGNEIMSGTTSDNSLFEQIYSYTVSKENSSDITNDTIDNNKQVKDAVSKSYTARIANVRHLENLSKEISNISTYYDDNTKTQIKFCVKKAVLTTNIDFRSGQGFANGTKLYNYAQNEQSEILVNTNSSGNIEDKVDNKEVENFIGITPDEGLSCFDGNGKTLSNIKVLRRPFNQDDSNLVSGTGLFTTINSQNKDGFTIRNLTIDTVVVKGDEHIATGVLLGSFNGSNLSIKNVKIHGHRIKVSEGLYAGGAVGFADAQSLEINDMHIGPSDGATQGAHAIIKSKYQTAGGIAGTIKTKNLYIKDVILNPDTSESKEKSSVDDQGYIFIQCTSPENSQVKNVHHAGGLIGDLEISNDADENSTIASSCVIGGHVGYVATTTNNGGNAGGIIGTLNAGKKLNISDSFITTYVQSAGKAAGGFIGEVSGSVTVKDCYVGGRTKKTYYLANSTPIEADDTKDKKAPEGRYNVMLLDTQTEKTAGGFIGLIDSNGNVEVSDSYTTASVYTEKSDGYIGGFVGCNNGTFKAENTYTTAFVHGGKDLNKAGTNAYTYIGKGTVKNISGQSKNYVLSGIKAAPKEDSSENEFIANAEKVCSGSDQDSIAQISVESAPFVNNYKDAYIYDDALKGKKYPYSTISMLNTSATGVNQNSHHGDWPIPVADDSEQTYDGDFGIIYYEIVQHGEAENGATPSKDYYYHGYVGSLTKDGSPSNYREVWTDDDKHNTKIDRPNNGRGLLVGHNEFVVEEGYLVLVSQRYLKNVVNGVNKDGTSNSHYKVINNNAPDLAINIEGNGFDYHKAKINALKFDGTSFDTTADKSQSGNERAGWYYKTVDGTSIINALGLKGYDAYCVKSEDLVGEAQKSSKLTISLMRYDSAGNPQPTSEESQDGIEYSKFYFQPIFSDTINKEPYTPTLYKIRSAKQLKMMLGSNSNSITDILKNGVAPVRQTLDISFSKNLSFTKYSSDTCGQISLLTTDAAYTSPSFHASVSERGKYSGSTPNNEIKESIQNNNADISNWISSTPVDGMGNSGETNYRLICLNNDDALFYGENQSIKGTLSDLIVERANSRCFIDNYIDGSGKVRNIKFINCCFTEAPINGSKGTIEDCDVINGQMGTAGLIDHLVNDGGTISNCHVYGEAKLADKNINGGYSPNVNTKDTTDIVSSTDPLFGYNLVTVGLAPNGKVTFSGNNAGFLGSNDTGGNISNCSFTGKVYGKNAAGFINSAKNSMSISKCYSNALIYSYGNSAAFATKVSGGKINQCHALGIIGAGSSGSGFISDFTGGSISNSYTAVWKTDSTSYDPFVGSGKYGITNCYVMSEVEGATSSDWSLSTGVTALKGDALSEKTDHDTDLGVSASNTVPYHQYMSTDQNNYPYPMPVMASEMTATAYGDWAKGTSKMRASFVNGEDLYLKITDPEYTSFNNYTNSTARYLVGIKGKTSNQTVYLKLTINPSASNAKTEGTVSVTYTDSNGNNVGQTNAGFYGLWKTTARAEVRILLDSITYPGGHFAQLFPSMIPGEDIEIESVRTLPLNSSNKDTISANGNAVATNSLFESVTFTDSQGLATLSKRRHLQNLSTDISGVDRTNSVNISQAQLSSGINFSSLNSDFIDSDSVGYSSSRSGQIHSVSGSAFAKTGAYSDTNTANFVGIHNDTLTNFDGKGNTLTSLRVKGEDTTVTDAIKRLTGYEDAGLFTSLGASDVTIQNVYLITSTSSSSSGSSAVVLAKTSGNGNVTLSSIKVSGSASLSVKGGSGNVGAMIGTAGGSGTISINNCQVIDTGTIESTNNAGGIIGKIGEKGDGATVNLNGCSTIGNITISASNNKKGNNGGGLVGSIGSDKDNASANDVNIYYCSAQITSVSADKQTGGLIGGCYGSNLNIEGSYAGRPNMYVHCNNTDGKTGTYNAGGLIGELRNPGIINNSAASCYVDASQADCAGGFIGAVKLTAKTTVSITNCYVGGHTDTNGKYLKNSYDNVSQISGFNIIGHNATGGFIGYMAGKADIKSCFTAASVKGTDVDANNIGYVGGFVGQAQQNYVKSFKNCYVAGKIFGGGHNSTEYGGAFFGNINKQNEPFQISFDSNQKNYVLMGMAYKNEIENDVFNDDELAGTQGLSDADKSVISAGISSIEFSDLTNIAVNNNQKGTTKPFNATRSYPYPVYTMLPDYSQNIAINMDGSVSTPTMNRIYYGDWEALASQTEQISVSLDYINGWDGNKQYNITIKNNSNKKADSITVTLYATGTVTGVSGNIMSGTVEGNIMTVTLNNYGNGFDAGTSRTFYIVVTGSGDFSVSTDMPSSSQAKKNSSAGLTAASQQIVTKKVKVKKAG